MDTKKSSSWSLAVIVAAVTLAALTWSAATWAGPGSQPRVVEVPAILQSCEHVPDHELQDIRGCYGGRYYFGMDIIVNLARSGPPVRVVPHPNMPEGTRVTRTGVSYRDRSVTYQGGIRPGSVYQAAQVRGNETTVTGVVNLNILVPESMFRPGVQSLSLPNSRQGITY